MSVNLLPHNKETYKKIIERFKIENRVAIVQPTGTGKSFIYLKWIEDHPNDTFILFSPSKEIFKQLYKYAQSTGNINLLKNVNMITYQSLIKKSTEELESLYADKIILDEFHRLGAEIWGDALNKYLLLMKKAQILGGTATPIRYLDNITDMSDKLFENNVANEMTLGEAVVSGILPMPNYIPVWYESDNELLYQYNQITDWHKNLALNKKLQNLKNHLEASYGADIMFAKYMPHNHGKYIVFCKNVEHLRSIKPALIRWVKNINNNIHFYVSITERMDREKEANRFIEDNDDTAIKFLLVIDRFNEGVHIDGLDGIIMLRPTISPIIYLQQMGRALTSNQNTPLIFDFVNNYQNVKYYLSDGTTQNVFTKEYSDSCIKYKKYEKHNISVDAFTIFEKAIDYTNLIDELNQVLRPDLESQWLKMYDLYVEYKKIYNKEPFHHERFNDAYLGKWVCYQRELYKHNKLSQNHVELLQNAGFVFDVHEKQWFDTFKEYSLIKDKSNLSKRLKNWCNRQRHSFCEGSLSQEKINLLLSVGFSFETQDVNFINFLKNVELYKKYKTLYKQEPIGTTVFENYTLGAWCNARRIQFREGKLTEKQIEILQDAKFPLTHPVHDERMTLWLEKYNLCKEYMNVFKQQPTHTTQYKGVSLGGWCKRQKNKYKNGNLSLEQIRLLNEIGFIFEENLDIKWTEKYKIYEEYVLEYREQPKKETIYKGFHLGGWYYEQKAKYKNNNLSQERYLLLCKLGFVFENTKKSFNEMFLILEKYILEFHKMPILNEMYMDTNIGSWCANIRTKYNLGELSEERINALKNIDFVFDPLEKQWNDSYELCKEFIILFKKVPTRKTQYKEINIGRWLGCQKDKREKLTPEKVKKLDALNDLLDKRVF